MSYILFDIGGTNTRVAVSEDLKKYTDAVSFKTPRDFKEGIEAIVSAVKKLTDREIRGMAGGIRGTLDSEKKMLVHDNVLKGWIDQPLVKSLKNKLKTTVLLENDAAIAGLGEAHFGAGKDYEIVAYHTVSTGVGGAKIENGVIDSYHVGFEPGHQILDIDRTILGDDTIPTLENLVSGASVEERTGIKPYEIPQSDAIWDQLANYLAHGLRNTILYWSPDVVVLGGSMILGNPRILLSDIQKHVNVVMEGETSNPLILDGELGDLSGIHGGMALLAAEV
ncbi:MAG: ROK family protein [Candidatus Paceibacterota bacterium]